MTIQECYKEMGADYEEVFHRLPRESMVRKFALMFLNDDSYPKLEQSLKEGNAQEVFRAAHTLKGVYPKAAFYIVCCSHPVSPVRSIQLHAVSARLMVVYRLFSSFRSYRRRRRSALPLPP